MNNSYTSECCVSISKLEYNNYNPKKNPPFKNINQQFKDLKSTMFGITTQHSRSIIILVALNITETCNEDAWKARLL